MSFTSVPKPITMLENSSLLSVDKFGSQAFYSLTCALHPSGAAVTELVYERVPHLVSYSLKTAMYSNRNMIVKGLKYFFC